MQGHEHESRLRHQLRILRRGVPLIAITVILTTAAAVGLSLRQDELYRATADVFLGSQSAASEITGVSQLYYLDPVREAETQARLAGLPAVSDRALSQQQLSDKAAGDYRVSWSVATNPNADILTFAVTAKDPALAERLATAYSKAYTDYRRDIDTAGVREALKNINSQLAELRQTGNAGSQVYNRLVGKRQQLQTIEALRGSNALLVRQASSPVKTQPKPTRNGVLGGILGLFLGISLVFVRDALNTRVRSVDEAEQRLRLPLLGRIPPLKAHRRNGSRLAMVDDPASVDAEVFRMLATNIDFMNMDRGATSLMITSANRSEGKSTSAVNLAAAYARRGLHVILVDMDLRSPSIAEMLEIESSVGVTSVALGRASIEEALVRVPLEQKDHLATGSAMTQQGVLEVLPTGPLPPDASEFVASPSVTRVLSQLSNRADLLLIDTPPVLPVSDALALSPRVDAVVVIARLGDIRRSSLDELSRLLEAAPIVKLGFIAAGVGSDEDQAYGGYGYGYGYGYQYGGGNGGTIKPPEWLPRRVRRQARRTDRQRRRDRRAAVQADAGPAGHAAATTTEAGRGRANERANLQRALELFNGSRHAGEIAEVTRSVAPPVANARAWDTPSSDVMLTVAWQHRWHQFLIDLSSTSNGVRVGSSGEDLSELPKQFKEWNVRGQADGTLVLLSAGGGSADRERALS